MGERADGAVTDEALLVASRHIRRALDRQREVRAKIDPCRRPLGRDHRGRGGNVI